MATATEHCSMADLDEWNQTHPSGTHVGVHLESQGYIQTKTRGQAILINGKLRVHLLGVQGAVDASELKLLHVRWVRMNRKGRKGHWIQGVWESAEAMDAAIERQLVVDSRITSHEISNVLPSDA